MKNRISFLLTILISGLIFSQQNSIEINGWTNINTFKCTNTNFNNSGSIYTFTGNQLPNVILNVNDFDCKNRLMTADFRKALNAEKFPSLTVVFLNFKKSPSNKFNAVVEVKMMNTAKKYSIEFSEYRNSLVGNKRVRFSDFNMVPPKKIGGIVYVKDELDLLFSLAVKN